MREVTRHDYTEDEIENLKNGNCWCGKPRSEFDKGMRVYCCKKHREDWYERTTTWSNFRDEYLSEKGKVCKKCGKDQKKLNESYDQRYDDWKQKILADPRSVILLEREQIEQLKFVEDKYQDAIDSDKIFKSVFGYYSPDGFPKKPEKEYFSSSNFQVDHIKPVAVGGDMWDKENLQVLCVDCHKEKTANDMKEIKRVRRNLKKLNEKAEVIV